MFIKAYSDFSVSKVGVRSDFIGPRIGANFKLDNDVSHLFPYINATAEDARFYEEPEYIQFTLDDILCTLYPMEVMAVPFADPDHARRFVTRFIDFLNHLHAKKTPWKPITIASNRRCRLSIFIGFCPKQIVKNVAIRPVSPLQLL